jgi:hypothetical protein
MELNKVYLYRMTHIENIPHIFKYGITHPDSINQNLNYYSIGDSSLISKRSNFLLKGGKTLGDFIPFYFGFRMPMLYVVQKGFNGVTITEPDKIVYCITSIQKILDLKIDFIFTNGHAINALTQFYDVNDVKNINDLIDFKAIHAPFWKDEEDLDLKRRKEAEFLVLGDLSVDTVLGYVVYSTDAQLKLLELGITKEKIVVKPNFYF